MGHAAPTPFQVPWSLPGVDETTRHAFALNTCSGCHHTETGTFFLQVSPRQKGVKASLSPFLLEQDLPFRANDLRRLLASSEAVSAQDGTEPEPPPSELEEGRPHRAEIVGGGALARRR